MAGPLVSVVVPTYDRAYCIRTALDSVFAQTHRELEAIVVDDGSTDGTAELLARTYAGEPRLRVLTQPNRGVSAARNHGLRAARGEFVALLDSDDLWLPWKTEAQLACLQALPEAGMIWTDMDMVSPTGEVLARRYLTTFYSSYRDHGWIDRENLFERWMPLSRVRPDLAPALGDPRVYLGDIFSEMVLGNLVHTSTVLLRRERLERVGAFDEQVRTGEDFDFHLRTCREGRVAYLDVSSILYLRGQTDQLTHGSDNALQVARSFLRTVTTAIARDRDRIRLPRVMLDEVLAEAHAWVGGLHFERGEHLAAFRELGRSLRHKPRQRRVAALLALNALPLPLTRQLRRGYRATRAAVRSPREGAPQG